jgi:hypothetical protein
VLSRPNAELLLGTPLGVIAELVPDCEAPPPPPPAGELRFEVGYS